MEVRLEHLTKRHQGYPLVNRVALEVAPAELFVLLGPPGSGASALLQMIAGLMPITAGRVLLQGRDITHLPPHKRGVGLVLPPAALFQHMSAADNIEFGLRVRNIARDERRRRRDELLEQVGLAGLGNRMPHQLSAAQQQRVALARALAPRPDLLLLDDPLSALDPESRTEVQLTLRRLQRDLRVTTIFASHDQTEAFALADRLGVMHLGRLLEVGPPAELYLRPQTEIVAMFTGPANLLVGQATATGVQVGPIHLPLGTRAGRVPALRRVQVLFRPEDVALAPSASALTDPPLGQAEVESSIFAGSVEHLRLRLPPLPGVRMIAPATPFGSDYLLIAALRAQDEVYRFPLRPGDRAWLGVRRFHALVHPGFSFLLLADGSAAAQTALAVGGQVARQAHARVTVLGCGPAVDATWQQIQAFAAHHGPDLAALETHATGEPLAEAVAWESDRQPHDLLALGFRPDLDLDLVERLVRLGEHHLLLISRPCPALARVLICVAGGEPGKADVSFAGRLVRHLGSDATLLSVLPPAEDQPQTRDRLERYLAAGVRTLTLFGVAARPRLRTGPVAAEIRAELAAGNYDLLVLGMSFYGNNGRGPLGGLVGQLLRAAPTPAVLVVRSDDTVTRAARLTFEAQAPIDAVTQS